MAKKKEQPESEAEVKEVPIEAVLGALINAVNAQTRMLEQLLDRIPPRVKLGS